MLTREEIISAYKKVNFPEKIIKSEEEAKNILFYTESKEPFSKNEKEAKILSQSFVLPWRLVQKNSNEINIKNNTFSRGSNFVPKEQLIDIKVENFKLIYDKYSIPKEIGLIYFKNNYGGMNGPFNLNQIQNMYKSKKIDSTFEFRPVDIFKFKDCEIFSFKSIKIINENNWIEVVINSPLLKYNQLSNIKNEPIKINDNELKTPKDIPEKTIKVIKDDKEEEKEEQEIKDKLEEKKNEVKAEKKEEKKLEKEEKKEIIKKEPEEKWETVQKKKNKTTKEKEIEEDNEIIGLKPKTSKEGKKNKKKKKQFEDADFDLGFKIK